MDRAARHRLIVDHVSWATWIARKHHQRWPRLDYDEMVGEALVALVESARRFDPKKGKFRSFVATRIHGAISDRVRRDDIGGRDQRSAVDRQIKPRTNPTRVDGDVAGVARRWRGFPSFPASQDEVVDARMALDRLKAAVDRLPPRLATAWRSYYFADRDLKTIGRELGVTESRVCQMMGEAWRLLGDPDSIIADVCD